MKKTLLFLMGTALSLGAQDFSGKWTGAADTVDASGVKRHMQQTLEIQGSGKDLVVRQIPSRGEPIVLKVVLDEAGPRFTLMRELDFEGGEHIRWHLELKDGKLTGTIWSVHDAPKKWGVDWSGPIEFTRAAQ
jgi:hypothetical protein